MEAQRKASLPARLSVSLNRFFSDPEAVRRAGWLALGTALVLRVLWGFLVPVIPSSDGLAYDTFAQNIATGNGYGWTPGNPTAWWPVGTSAVYAVFYALFGHTYLPVVVFNIAVGVLTVVLAMSLARRWFGDTVALVTGWLLAVWPVLVQFTTVMASEPIFNLLILTTLWLASMPRWKWLPRTLALGITLAAASFVRPVALIMAPFAFLREAFVEKKWVRALTGAVLASTVMIILILPWSFRNFQVFHHFVLISNNAGTNMWQGNNPAGTGETMDYPNFGIKNEAELNDALNKQAMDFILKDPGAFVTRSLWKVVLLHDRETIGVAWNEQALRQTVGAWVLNPLKVISNGFWYLMLIFAVTGIVFLFKRDFSLKTLIQPPFILWMYFIIVHAVTVVQDRYHMPSIPFIAVLAAYGLVALVETGAKRGELLPPAGK